MRLVGQPQKWASIHHCLVATETSQNPPSPSPHVDGVVGNASISEGQQFHVGLLETHVYG